MVDMEIQLGRLALVHPRRRLQQHRHHQERYPDTG